MTSFRYSAVISLMVIVIGAFIATYWIGFQGLSARAAPTTDSGGRNERSTPRSFILPATPAVALEQELRLREQTDKRQAAMIDRCAAGLVVRGYDVGDEIVSFNAKLVEAIFLYQEQNGLVATGRLNDATRRSLGC
jgi:hypothetical protein